MGVSSASTSDCHAVAVACRSLRAAVEPLQAPAREPRPASRSEPRWSEGSMSQVSGRTEASAATTSVPAARESEASGGVTKLSLKPTSWSRVTASRCTGTPRRRPSHSASVSEASSSRASGRWVVIVSAARPIVESGCTCTATAPCSAASRTTDSSPAALYCVSVVVRAYAVPLARSARSPSTVRAKAPRRPRMRSCSCSSPSTETATASVSDRTASQRRVLRSSPLVTSEVTIPSQRAWASR